ncbi:MAG: hypothetical protein DMG51_18540, partial [Acidobacteria bacterium]
KRPDEQKDEKKAEPVKPIQIDLYGISTRIATVPISAGILNGLAARKDKFFYVSTPQEARQFGTSDRTPKSVLHVYEVSKREDKVLLEGIDGYDLDKEGKKVIYKAGPVYGIVEAAPGKAKVGEGKLNLSELQVKIDPREEWRQVFREAWRIERDFYWDPHMTGHNWKTIGERYEALLPWVAHRSDLNYLIGEMIAELSTSHTYVSGGDQPAKPHVNVGMLGADFEPDGGYFRITKIYPGENWNDTTRSPLTEPGLKVKAGDYLIAVDGQETHSNQDVYSYFQDLAAKLITLKINSKSTPEGAWEITVKPTSGENGVRYLDWTDANRHKVEEATGGRIGYMHVPDTSFPGIIAFDKQFTAQLDKDGIIVDERYNSGGQIPDFYTEKLKRELLSALAPREGKDVPWPPVAIYGPRVMIVNELAGSGGDAFPWFFHRQKIGPIVGTRTWGGLVGISRGIPLHDGGNVSAPEFAFWSTDNGGEWIVENHGVDPDYVVPQRPDLVISGHDPQLEKAIEKVEEATGGRIGYMHVPDTSFPGIIAFDKQFTAQLDKDGIIIDERYNSGGQIPDFYTEKLKRELLSALAPREGKDVPWPPVAIYGPRVMIVNELAGSGGDAFPWFFHRQKIGPIVGTRTWGGLVGISRGIPLHDGGNVSAPEFAFWSTDNGGEWIVENHGVDPDYVVPQRPDLVISGHDPQLEKAIELAEEALRNYKGLPPRPKYPVAKE